MKQIDNEEFIWSQKYRPQTIEDCILPDHIKSIFQNIKKSGEFQSLLLAGVQGSGKTTVAKALCNELQLDFMMINASDESGIDTLRNKIKSYASTVSFMDTDRPKVVILDEADYLSGSAQAALRGLIEEHSKNCRYILTCNHKNRIVPAIQSRCTTIDFIPADFKQMNIIKQMLGRTKHILQNESVEFDNKVLAELVYKWAPDFRRTINELQRYSTANGSIDSGIFISGSVEVDFRQLIKYLKEKNFKQLRQWTANHVDVDATEIFQKLYETSSDIMEGSSIPNLILILSEYEYRSSFVTNQEINTTAALTEVMAKCKFR